MKCLMTVSLRRMLLPSVFLLSLFSFGFSLLHFSDVSAFTITDSGNETLDVVYSTYGTSAGLTGQQGSRSGNDLVFTFPYDYTVNNLHLQLENESFTSNSIIHFTITYTVRKAYSNISNNYASLKYFGLHLANGATILSDSCFEAPYEVAQIGHSFSCSYTAFVPFTNNYISASLNTRIVGPNDNGLTYSEYQTQLVISPISWFTLSTEALSQTDLNNLSSILQSLPSGASKADIQSAVESAIGSSGIVDEQQKTTDAVDKNTAQEKETTDAVKEQTDWLKDDTPPDVDVDTALVDPAGWLPAGPVDSILTIPIQFMQGIINVLTGSDNCQPINLPLPYVDDTLVLPCMRPILNQMGFLTIYEVVGGVVSMFIIWETLKWLYEFVDKTLSFREDNSGLWGGL